MDHVQCDARVMSATALAPSLKQAMAVRSQRSLHFTFRDHLRSDPRFQDLLRRMNFPPRVDSLLNGNERQVLTNGLLFTDSIRRLIPCDKPPSHQPLLTEMQRSKHIGNDKS